MEIDEKKIEFQADDFKFAHRLEAIDDEKAIRGESNFKEAFTNLRKNKGAIFGFFSILVIVFFACIGPMMNSYTYSQQITGNENMAPRIQGVEKLGIFDGSETMKTSTGNMTVNKYKTVSNGEEIYYWFGSDVLGRDIFTRTWTGTRISLYIALVAVVVDLFIGMTYGLISGYFGGRTDMIMQRFVEVLNGIPNLVIVTLLIIAFKPGLMSITLAIAFTGWIGMSRVARAQMLKLKEQEFVLAAKTLGAGDFVLIFREILPNVFSQLLVMSMFSVPSAIFTEAFLAFIGIGIPVPHASLGSIINESFKSMTTHPYMLIPPIVVLALLMLSFNLLADGLRDALDPTMKEM